MEVHLEFSRIRSMMKPRQPHSDFFGRRMSLFAGLAVVSALCVSLAHAAGTYYVDADDPNGSPGGPGTPENPYSSINAAVAARGGPGTTILVAPGVYREQITVPVSGLPGSPFVIKASGPAVVIDGADALTDPGLWEPQLTTVFYAPSVASWVPNQVYVDGVRLAMVSGVSPLSIPPQSFLHIAGVGLYVNLGGENPGSHQTFVSRRANGFRVPGRSHVRIEGFQISRANEKGVYVLSASNNVSIVGNQVSQSGAQGIQISGSTSCYVGSNVVFNNGDNGIMLTNGVTTSVVEWNEAFGNARPNVRAANGLNLSASHGNRIIGNRWHHNQDTGSQFGASNDNLSMFNSSWSNGDHGFDHLGSTGSIHHGDVAWGNTNDGFSFEGNAPNSKLFNCIGAENGLLTNHYNLWVDVTSNQGFTSNSNVFWNSTAQPPVKFINVRYSSVAAYSAATGRDSRSRQDDPRFVDPGAGDFRLTAGSAAIDLADATLPDWPIADLVGGRRRDDPFTPNGGMGAPQFGDAGAFEFIPPDEPPLVTAPETRITKELVQISVLVTAEDPNGQPITSFVADLSGLPAGSNATFLTNESNTLGALTWTPARGDRRSTPYVVAFSAGNAFIGQATTAIQVNDNVDHAPIVTAPSQVNVSRFSAVTVNVTAIDPDGDAITSLTADLSKLQGSPVFIPSPDKRSGTLVWTPTRKGKFDVRFTARNTLTGSTTTKIEVRNAVAGEPGFDPAASSENSEELAGPPATLALSNAFPNPSRGDAVSFVLDLPRESNVLWSIYDIQGRQLFEESRFSGAGRTTLRWEQTTGHRGPGVYFARVHAGEESFVRRFFVTE